MEKEDKKIVSYSQFKIWQQCPWRWKLRYIDRIKEDEPSIHLIFGTAMHETLQCYLLAMYSNSVKHADSLDLKKILSEKMSEIHTGLLKNYEELEKYVSKKVMVEFYYDGVKIIDWFKSHRVDYFNSRTEELIGIEVSIEKELGTGLKFLAYLDIVIRNKETGKIRIIDFKTSTKGWNSYAKNDSKTTSQLILYKALYSAMYKVDPKDISVEYMILKRKLYEDIPYPQKQIQKYIPASGKPTMNKVVNHFQFFVESCFTSDGSHDTTAVFPKIATSNNCRFCEFKNKPELCSKEN